MPRFYLSLVALFLIAGSDVIRAQSSDSGVTANVLTRRVAVGEFGTLFLKVSSGDAVVPERIAAEGLDIVASGSQSNFTIQNGARAFATTYIYRFRGNTPGKYTIPSVDLTVQGQKYSTAAIEIEIFKPDPNEEKSNPTREQFAKLELNKDEFYVNELVPFTVTAYVRGRNSISQVVSPTLAHESFVIKSFREVRTDGGELGNTYYSSAVIDSHLFALKPGSHRLGPGEIGVRVLDTRRGGGFLSIFPRAVLRELATNAVDVTVKPLPVNAPASFTGGVGDFELSVVPSTTEVAIGDPISMEFKVEGVGNLRTMSAPKFSVQQTGIWKTYDPSKTLTDEEDSDGFKKGRALFSQVIIPEARVDNIPPYELTYFDPSSGEYVTRKTEPIPIVMKAGQSVAPVSEVSSPAGNEFTADRVPATKPVAEYNDILYIRTGTPRWLGEVRPGATGTVFTVVQSLFSIAFFTVLGIGGARWISRFRSERSSASPVETFAQSLKRLPKNGASRHDLYHAVATSIMLWKAEHPDAEPKVMEVIGRVFDRCNTQLYGGKKNGDERIPDAEAEEIRSIIHRLPRK